jgi:hypothetical protein
MIKKIITLSLSMSILSSSLAFAQTDKSQLFCAEAYQGKFKQIDHHRSSRKAGKIALIVTGGVLGALTFVPFAGAQAIIAGLFLVSPGASLGVWVGDKLDREEGLKNALTFLDLAEISRDVLIEQIYQKYIDQKMREINYQVPSVIIRPLTRDEVIRQVGPKENLNLNSAVDVVLNEVNQARAKEGVANITYKQLQTLIQTSGKDDSFCPVVKIEASGEKIRRPKTAHEIVKVLKKRGVEI